MGKWAGVRWAPLVNGKCSRHGGHVETGSACIACHGEQLAAARAGSPEWEQRRRGTPERRDWRGALVAAGGAS